MPIYLVMAPGSRRDALARALGGRATLLEDLAGLSAERAPGLVLIDPDAADAAGLTELARRRLEGWRVALVASDGEEVRPLTAGARASLEEIVAYAADPAVPPPAFLDLEEVLTEIARLRHDLNNPLTSALAETQLLLLDAGEGDLKQSLEVVQEQLRRMRDMLAASRRLRPPRR